MHKLTALALAAAVSIAAAPAIVVAQGTTQTIHTVDVKTIGTGYRSSKIVGSAVMNDNKESIGKIDDLIITRDAPGTVAVISVGGFLGIGGKLVAVPFSELQATPDNSGFILSGATKDNLSNLPEFKYNNS